MCMMAATHLLWGAGRRDTDPSPRSHPHVVSCRSLITSNVGFLHRSSPRSLESGGKLASHAPHASQSLVFSDIARYACVTDASQLGGSVTDASRPKRLFSLSVDCACDGYDACDECLQTLTLRLPVPGSRSCWMWITTALNAVASRRSCALRP
jgi:hypothetical protein